MFNRWLIPLLSLGEGTPSDPANIRTSCDAPSQVRNLIYSSITDNSLTVQWSAPAKVNGELTGLDYAVS